MNQLKRKKFFTILFIVAFIGMMLTILPIFEVKAAVNVVYDSFDDYDTDYDRQGRKGGIYAQIATWGSAAGTNVAEAGRSGGSVRREKSSAETNEQRHVYCLGKRNEGRIRAEPKRRKIREGVGAEFEYGSAGFRYYRYRYSSNYSRFFCVSREYDAGRRAGTLADRLESTESFWKMPDGVKSVVKSVNGSFD